MVMQNNIQTHTDPFNLELSTWDIYCHSLYAGVSGAMLHKYKAFLKIESSDDRVEAG